MTAVNLGWNAKVEYDSGETGWMALETDKDVKAVSLKMYEENTASEPRPARIIFTTDAQGVGPVAIKVTLEAESQPL